MSLQTMIVPNEDFQTSINIDFDFGSKAKIESLIPTDSVCRYLEEIIRDVIVTSNNRAKLLVGAYGKGKSHVVLAALTSMWEKDPSSFKKVIEAYEKRGLGFGESFERFVTEGKRLLPVIISGSTSDLRHSFLFALRNALRYAGLEELMPTTNYDGAIKVLERWRDEYPETLSRFEDFTGKSAASTVSLLRNMDTSAYELFVEAYPSLTSGGQFDALDGAEVIEIYENVLAGLSRRGIDGIYIVYDEFSKYLETSLDRATFEDTKLLQDLAEACNRSESTRQLHLLLVSHKSLANYIDSSLPKEKVDGWRGVSGRFREIEMVDDANQYYELISNAVVKDNALWRGYLSANECSVDRTLSRIGQRYVGRGLFDEEIVDTVTHGCFPLHPLTTYLLSRMSEKVAQNERTLFTFICSNEEHALGGVLPDIESFVSPDCVYSYFEPLLRKEYYTSPLHKTYELARSSIQRVDEGSLECRIIKTIAAIDIVAQYDRVAPTRQTIIDLYSDCGYDPLDINAALDKLIDIESIVYLKRSNAFLKLKETSGIHIESEITDRAERLRSTTSLTEILNKTMRGRALYPSRYNEERGIVRYFDCGFASKSSLSEWRPGDQILASATGDGEVVAICAESPDELDSLKAAAKSALSAKPMTVIVFPRKYSNIAEAAFRFEAARQLKDEADGDSILVEEYEIVLEDYAEIVDDFIAGYFQPELMRSLYFVGGVRKNVVTRKRKLTEELSRLCDESYCDTPRITSEALNKNDLTGTAFSSRTKILKALCAKSLEPNLGFLGNGQETSMARSAFEKTGLISNIESSPTEPGKSLVHGIDKVILTIRQFIENAQDVPFSSLYEKLMGPELRIGLRRGPIPLYLAFVLRDYRNEVIVMHEGEERTINETLLDDISKQPHAYTLTRLNWSPQMAVYLDELAELFGLNPDSVSRNDVADAIRLWFAELPQVTRNSRYDHTISGGNTPIPRTRSAFFNTIRRIDTESSTLLFEELPRVFGLKPGDPSLVSEIEAEKIACDLFLDRAVDALSRTLIRLFDPEAHDDSTLGSVLHEWIEKNPSVDSRVFSGVNQQILYAIKAANGDDRVTVNRLAKAATSLRIEDWNDVRFDDFIRLVSEMKSEVEGFSNQNDDVDERAISIRYKDGNGVMRQKSFDPVVPSNRARLLKNSIRACLSEMGGALQPEEKRQVVFEVLEELC